MGGYPAAGPGKRLSLIDLHTHLLPGIDDGPRDLAGSLALAEAAAAAGTGTICATPHLRADFPLVRPGELASACARVDAQAGGGIRVVPGGELALSWATGAGEEDLRLSSLGQRGHDLLVETPYDHLPPAFEEWLFSLTVRGFRIVLAHPERNPTFQRDPERLAAIVRRGTLVQLTASSLTRSRRSATRRLALALVSEGLAHVLASDAHAAGGPRGPDLRPAVAEIDRAVRGRGRWMANEVPAAILAAEPLPPFRGLG